MKFKLNHTWNCEVELVDILTPGKKPDGVKVDEYLGSKALQSFRKGLFKETQLVFKLPSGAYVVIPDTPGNAWLWSIL
jgi:hypothetical protein